LSLLSVCRSAVADLDMIRERDPSMKSRTEAMLHPAVIATWGYRVAHRLHLRDLRRTARLLSAVARIASGGIEIHPGARIGRGFFIDHGTGVVIGETAVIGEDVTLFHQVTLGSVGWWHDGQRPEGSRRHPRLGDRVVIGANATLLGPITVGDDSVVGAQALVIRDVASGSRVLAPTAEPQRRRRPRIVRSQVQRSRHPALTAAARRDSAAFPIW
jgi:serine O-acetyltransferase